MIYGYVVYGELSDSFFDYLCVNVISIATLFDNRQ